MEESFEHAIGELKRVDHLFYVSLKYTRTVDMIKHVIQRLINCLEFSFETLLKHAKEKKRVDSIPSNVGLKCELLKKIFQNDALILEHVNFYFLLKKVIRANYTKREEFRRHVTMIATIDNGEVVEINIDVLKEQYTKTKEFVEYVKTKIAE